METVVPPTNPAFGFWLHHFGDKLVDEVQLSELLNCLPNKEDESVEEAYMWILKGRPNPDTVTLRHLGNTCEWYGDWIHNGTALTLKSVLGAEKWFLGFVNQIETTRRGFSFVLLFQKPCFIVRCNETNTAKIPFTVDIFTTTMMTSHQVERVNGLLKYDTQSLSVFGKDIHELIQFLSTYEMLDGAYPYDGAMSWIYI